MIKFKGYSFIDGGVCATKGFVAGGVHSGLRKNRTKPDLALIYNDVMCNAAAVYTQNKVKGAPIVITKKNLANHKAQAIIVNSGNANTCNPDGEEKAAQMCAIAADALNISASDIIVASTGIIGEVMPIEPIQSHIQQLKNSLSATGNDNAALAILTTDTCKKECAVTFDMDGTPCTIGGMCKGSGMIHPNMATMLCFITTDANIDSALLQLALTSVTNKTFNMISVDGDTSTNDMVAVLASGSAENPIIDDIDQKSYELFVNGLYAVMMNLARATAQDGEGATKLLECTVTGAADDDVAKTVAKSVITSSLFKCAMFGQDPNWGRILCAIGYAECDLDINQINVRLKSTKGDVMVCKNGRGTDFVIDDVANILHCNEVKIIVCLGIGDGEAVAWGCDMTYDYVKINAAYHS